MKKILLLAITALFFTNVNAQEIIEENITIMKAEHPAVTAKYNVSRDILAAAWGAQMAKYGIKKGAKVKGGGKVYKGVSIPAISEDKIDLYAVMSGKKENSSISILVSKGYDNFVSSESAPESITVIKDMLSNLVNGTKVAQVEVDIEKQEKVVSKAKKTNSTAIKTGENLASEMKKLEKRIADNKQAQEEAAGKLKTEETTLTELKTKLESLKN